mmetsp:Transcript_9555/g.17953  ORF Transcript_9555/g.17953 Transcript_9555/m.17953 type:complete len:200 (+) Transcript_9555:73-672(+)
MHASTYSSIIHQPIIIYHLHTFSFRKCRHWRHLNMTRLSLYNFINNSIFQSFLGRHEKISITILLNLILGLIGIFRNISIQNLPNKKNLLGLNFNICCLTLCPSQGLMNHNPGIWQSPTLSLGPCSQKKGTHTGSHTKANSGYVAGYVLHGIINGHSSTDASSGRINIKCNILLWVFVGEIEQLSYEDIGHFIIDLLSQ